MTGRRIAQPGPALEPRVLAVDCRGTELAFTLEPGVKLLAGVAAAFGAAGFTSAAVELEGGAFGPFTYVIPALSETPEHAAFYSEMRRPGGATPLTTARLTLGTRNGEPWFHCHGFWTAEGRLTGGHVIPEETVVAEPIRCRALGLRGAAFTVRKDPETNFSIFHPVPDGRPEGDVEAVAIRIRPHEDVAATFEALCAARGWERAVIRGGVASTIGARFESGADVDNFATEVFVVAGRVEPGPDGRPVAAVDAALIDYTGALAMGRYVRGDNPVLMTFEAVLQRA
ncbi:DUF296 domain-containing protein [Prosthecomicrobium sp. N25]|uniref:DUF296 domain-containing protein n=1 Tax=Prosthecomicrobium sp. N25 TaxID=3129254 RepID=UPI00307740B8